jgi:hypothetical protein
MMPCQTNHYVLAQTRYEATVERQCDVWYAALGILTMPLSVPRIKEIAMHAFIVFEASRHKLVECATCRGVPRPDRNTVVRRCSRRDFSLLH